MPINADARKYLPGCLLPCVTQLLARIQSFSGQWPGYSGGHCFVRCADALFYRHMGGGVMGRSEIVEVEMPDGTVINAEVVVSDSITDVAAGHRLKLDEAKDSIASFVRWAVGAVAVPAESDASVPAPE